MDHINQLMIKSRHIFMELIMIIITFLFISKDFDPKIGPWKLSLDLPCYEPFMKYR